MINPTICITHRSNTTDSLHISLSDDDIINEMVWTRIHQCSNMITLCLNWVLDIKRLNSVKSSRSIKPLVLIFPIPYFSPNYYRSPNLHQLRHWNHWGEQSCHLLESCIVYLPRAHRTEPLKCQYCVHCWNLGTNVAYHDPLRGSVAISSWSCPSSAKQVSKGAATSIEYLSSSLGTKAVLHLGANPKGWESIHSNKIETKDETESFFFTFVWAQNKHWPATLYWPDEWDKQFLGHLL